MGNSHGGASGGNARQCTGSGAPGLNQHCYNVGQSHATDRHGDPIGHGIDAAPCTLNENANRCYAQGYMDGRGSNGVTNRFNSSGDGDRNPYGCCSGPA